MVACGKTCGESGKLFLVVEKLVQNLCIKSKRKRCQVKILDNKCKVKILDNNIKYLFG